MKMTKARKIALGLSLTATALAGAAYAQQAAKHDGPITRAEAQAKAQEMFARMDANKDGKLDQADHAARRAAMFDRIDTDRNGQISRAEFDAMAERGPRGPEAGDGSKGPEDGHRMHRFGHRGGHHGGMMMGRMADADKDGAVSQAEFVNAALQRFDRADANRDGTVTREERQAAFKAMRDRMHDHKGAPGTPPPAN